MTEPRKRVVFVCIENSNRSQMAEAFARMRGGGSVEAYSSGSKPSGRVNPRAIEFMREVGYDLSAHTSKPLSEIPAVEFDAAITMGCGDECPMVRAKLREDWGSPTRRNSRPRASARSETLLSRRSKTSSLACRRYPEIQGLISDKTAGGAVRGRPSSQALLSPVDSA